MGRSICPLGRPTARSGKVAAADRKVVGEIYEEELWAPGLPDSRGTGRSGSTIARATGCRRTHLGSSRLTAAVMVAVATTVAILLPCCAMHFGDGGDGGDGGDLFYVWW